MDDPGVAGCLLDFVKSSPRPVERRQPPEADRRRQLEKSDQVVAPPKMNQLVRNQCGENSAIETLDKRSWKNHRQLSDRPDRRGHAPFDNHELRQSPEADLYRDIPGDRHDVLAGRLGLVQL